MSTNMKKGEKKELRKQLLNFSTINDFLQVFEKAKKIVFITGAGVSVSCGIPDFRSASGIYNTMECQEIGIPSPELLFDLEFFLMDSGPFYKYAHNLMPVDRTPSPAHQFIALLESKKKLLRNYTQNIDGLERISGQKKVIECHGSMDLFQCLDCRKKVPRADVHDTVMRNEVPLCMSCGGIMKPMITFFGERSPAAVSKYAEEDMSKCDLIIVMGTSLKVGGAVVDLLNKARSDVPQVLINLNHINPPSAMHSEGFDLSLLGTCDDVVTYISDMTHLGEDSKLRKSKMASFEKLKKKKVCKHCNGTRILKEKVVIPAIAPEAPAVVDQGVQESIPVCEEPFMYTCSGRRIRKPSNIVSESMTVKKKPQPRKKRKNTNESVNENVEKECTFCKDEVIATAAMESSLAPISDFCCTPNEHDRQFVISSRHVSPSSGLTNSQEKSTEYNSDVAEITKPSKRQKKRRKSEVENI